MEMIERVAACSCGQLTATVRGEPLRVSVCHCLACQRRSGSAFAAQARFPEEGVTVAGQSREHALTGDEGGTARFRFCPECGATVAYRMDALPGVLAIPIGAFADPGFPPPQVAVYESRRHPWVQVTGTIEQLG